MGKRRTIKETINEIVNKSNTVFDKLANCDIDKVDKLLDNLDTDILSEPTSVERRSSMEVKDNNRVKIEISEKKTYNFKEKTINK